MFDLEGIKKRNKNQAPGQWLFIQWMANIGCDPLTASAMDIMNFLAHGLKKMKWKLGTACTYKSSILQLLQSDLQTKIQEDGRFQEFLSVMGTNSFKQLHNAMINLMPIVNGL